MTTPIVDFLVARIDEEERTATAARDAVPAYDLEPTAYSEMLYLAGGEGAVDAALTHAAAFDPGRVLAECTAKRLAVDMARRMVSDPGAGQPVPATGRALLEALALPYTAHPDFRPDWWIDDSVLPGQYGPTADYGEG